MTTNATGDGKSYLNSVTGMDTSTPANGDTFQTVHQQLLNNDSTLMALLKAYAQGAANSGVLNWSSLTTGLTSNLNAFKFGSDTALVTGNLQQISNLGGMTDTTNLVQLNVPPSADVTPALPGSARDDLAFLEFWRDATSGAWQGRESIVDGVDFATYPEGLSAPNVYAQGGNASVTTKTFTKSSTDNGLYVAGDGSATAKTTLNTVDGYVYAIPLFRVRRRNSTAYDPDTNVNGGREYISTGVTLEQATVGTGNSSGTVVISTPSTSFVADPTASNAFAGMRLDGGYGSIYVQSSSYNSTTGYTTLTTIPDMPWQLGVGSGLQLHSTSDRPDGLYSNIIDASDIIDLRHQVSLTGLNMESLLEKNLDLLLRGQLTTNKTLQYTRDYIGIQPLTDDANTLLLANLDGTIDGVANGVALNEENSISSPSFVNGIQGLAYYANGYSNRLVYSPTIDGTKPLTIEYAFKPATIHTNDMVGLLQTDDGVSEANFGLQFYTEVKSGGGYCITTPYFTSSSTAWMHWSIPNGRLEPVWYVLRFTVDPTNNAVELYLNDEQLTPFNADGVPLNSSGQYAYPGAMIRIAKLVIPLAAGIGDNAGLIGSIGPIRLSNIVRSNSLVPNGFSLEGGDKILDGPDADFSFWSDDVGGTTGVNGRTNPYGLTNVPNQMAARVSYNGNEVRHYYGQGITPGCTAGASNNAGTSPTGSFDTSCEYDYSTSNETANGTLTTFTFNAPLNFTGIFLIDTLSGSNLNYVVTVNGSFVTPTSASYDSATKVLTVVLSSAPANGATVQGLFERGSRHAHFVPSTKGFILHDWTDDQASGDGTTTVFQTTEYNVTSVNHVRVGGEIQNGGYSTSGLNARTSLTVGATAGATQLTVADTSNFANGQNIRIQKDDGTLYTSQLAATGAIVNSTTLALATALPTGISFSGGNTIEGAALVTFTAAPVAGTNNIDIVYESVLTPSEGDYIRIAYQSTPYQGCIGDLSLQNKNVSMVYLRKNTLVTSYGTGKYTSSNGSTGLGSMISTPLTPNLPAQGNHRDADLKSDSVIFSGIPVRTNGYQNALRYFAPMELDGYTGNYFPTDALAVPQFTISNSTPDLRGYQGGTDFELRAWQLSTSVPHITAWMALITYNNELYLMVKSEYLTSTDTQIYKGATDLFKLQGRPLIKNYGGVSA